MRILFNCSEYPPFRNGGIGSVTKIVAEELCRRGHQVYVVGFYPELKSKKTEIIVNGVHVIACNASVLKGNWRQLYMYLNKLRLVKWFIQKELSDFEDILTTFIENYNIDVLEIPDFYKFNQYNCHLSYKRFSIPTIIRVHGSVSFMHTNIGKSTFYSQKNDNAHFLRADYLSSVSKYSLEYVNQHLNCIHFKQFNVIYNPIEDSFLKDNSPSKNKVILYIGKIIETKGAFSLLKAFNLVASKFQDWKLFLIGGGDIEQAKKLVSTNYRDRVKFLGFCDRETIRKEIDNCSFACIPSYFENFSMVPLEIMARKRCVIYTHRTSGPEIIQDGVDGYTVNPEDVNIIAEKVSLLIDDIEMRNRFAEKAYLKVVNHFSASKIVDTMESFYLKAIVESK